MFGRLGGGQGGYLPPVNGSWRLSVDQAYTATSAAKVLLDTSNFNSGLTADLVTNHRITIVRPGVYWVSGQVYFTGGTASGNILQAFVYKNGASVANARIHATAASDIIVPVGALLTLAATDYLELFASKSGNDSTFYSSADATFFNVVALG